MLAERLTLDLRRLARTDGLTGLLNRSALIEAGARLVDACRARGQVCSVLMFDLDHFKTINDSRSEEHTSELQSLMRISYAVFCLKKKKHKEIIAIHVTTLNMEHIGADCYTAFMITSDNQ